MDTDDRGAGPPVVLLHGQPGDRRDWDAVVAEVGERARVLVPDRPGYGRTGGPAGGIAANGDAVVSLLDRFGIDRAVLGGHSWGGAVALDVAQRHPERVASLVLVASVGAEGSIEDFDRLLGAPVIGPVLAIGGLLALRAPRVRRLVAPNDVVHLLSKSWVFSWRSFVTEQRALTAELPAITAALPRTSVPTVVVMGENDRVVRPRVQEALASALPNSSLVRLPGRGHLLPWEAPSDVAAAVVSVL